MNFSDNTTYNYILLSVEQGEKYNVKTYFTSANTYYIYMCDENGIIVSRGHNATDISGSQTFDVEIPDGIAQLYIQGYSTAAVIASRMNVKKYGLHSIRYVLDSTSEKIEEAESAINMLSLNNYTLADARVEIGQMSTLGTIDTTVTNRMRTRIFPLYRPTLVGAGEFSFGINQYKAYNYSSSQIIKNWATIGHGNEKVLVYGDSYPIYIMLGGKKSDDTDITQQDMDDFASAITLEGLEPDVMYATIAMFSKFALTGCSWDAGTVYQSSDGHVTHTGVGWGEILGRRNGCTVGNFAIGGSNLRSWFNYEGHLHGFPALLQAEAYPLYILTEGNSNDANAFVVNDDNYSASVPSTTTYYVGTIEDISTRQSYHDYPCTFYGYYGRVIEMIQEHAPNTRIVISSPDTTAITTDIRKALRTACKNIATYYGLPYMDIEKDPYYDIYVNTLVGYHPSAPTYSGWAMAIERQFSKCVKNNLPYFQLYSGLAITAVEVEWEAVSLE